MATGRTLRWTAPLDFMTSPSRTVLRGALLPLFLFLIMNTIPAVRAVPSAEEMKDFMVFQGYFEYYGWTFLLCMVIFGVGANTINIRIFNKMGLHESVNVVFCAISWTDLISCVDALVYDSSQHPWFRKVFMEHLSLQVWEFPGSLAYIIIVMSATVNTLVTAYMALQRCLCVVIPMKVKSIFTIQTTKKTLFAIVMYSILMCAPYFFILKFEWIHVNDTINGTVVNQRSYFGRIRFESYYRQPIIDFINYNQTLIKLIVNVQIVVCTIILWRNLVLKSKWRKEAAATDAAASASRKEVRVIKTVVFICTLYLCSTVPNTVFLVYFISEPGYQVPRWSVYHWYLYRFFFIVSSIATTTNITANIFIYYSVSTQYREVFNQMFSFHRWRKNKDEVATKKN